MDGLGNTRPIAVSFSLCRTRVLTMEPNPLMSAPSNSSPKSSQKRTSSPGAPAPHPKKPKKDPGQGYSDKNKRRRRKKKQPITRDSGILSGLMQNVRSSSLSPEPPLPSASCSTENRLSFMSSQSDSLLESSSISPSLDRSPPVVIASSSEVQPATQIPLRKEHAVQVLHCESKVCFSSLSPFLFHRVQIFIAPSRP